MVSMKTSPRPGKGKKGVNFVAEFRHWRTGKMIRAADHGIKGFPIGSGHKKQKSK